MVIGSLALNRLLTGLSPLGFRIFNLVLHAANATLLFLLLESLLAHQGLAATIRSRLAAVIAGVWLVHPLTTNVSLYIVQRAEGLMVFFYLLTLFSAVRYFSLSNAGAIAKNAVDTQRPSVSASNLSIDYWRSTAVWACAFGMLSKESMVTAPIAVYLMDASLFARSAVSPFRKRASFYFSLFATWIVLMVVMILWPRGRSVGSGGGMSAIRYLSLQCEIIPGYIRKVFWPSDLHLDYWLMEPTSPARTAIGFLALAVSFLLASYLLARGRMVGFLAILVFLVLSPTSSIVPIYSMTGAEYRMYLPMACVIAIVVLMLHTCLTRLLNQNPKSIRLVVAASLIAALLLGYRTWTRSQELSAPEIVWKQVLEAFPDNPRALHALGHQARLNGDLAVAKQWFLLAVERQPKHADAYVELGMMEVESGNAQSAIGLLQTSVELWPYNASAWTGLAIAHAKVGNADKAESAFLRAISIAPHLTDPQFNYAIFLLQQNRMDEGKRSVAKVLSLDPHHSRALQVIEQLDRSRF